MKREIDRLANEEFDILIIGGGIYGAIAAWDAVLRGFKVALIDKNDFGSGTSSNSLKIIHGGLRYLQHADFARMRESIRERRNMMYVAPHLTHPLPCVMGTYGHMVKGPEAMRLALLLNDIISADRNKSLDQIRRLPAGRLLSKSELLDIVPYIDQNNLNGGAMWYDGYMSNSERLLMSFVHSAVEQGATAANYVGAEEFLLHDSRVTGVKARDVVTNTPFPIRSKMTLNTAGPWINNLLALLNGKKSPRVHYSTAMNLVINKRLSDVAFGASTKSRFKDRDAFISTGSRLLFFLPWRHVTLAGTAHKPFYGNAEDYQPSEQDIEEFLGELNSALPGTRIERNDVIHQLGGLLPMANVNEKTGDVQLQKHFRIIDHKQADGIAGLLTLVSVKYTTSRDVAEKAIDQIAKQYHVPARSKSAQRRIWGGDIDDYADFITSRPDKNFINPKSLQHLKSTYGSKYSDILKLTTQDSQLSETLSTKTPILNAEIIYAIQHEMAVSLSDVVMRRTKLGTAGPPDATALQNAASLMANELNWCKEKKNDEIDKIKDTFIPKK